MGFVITIGEAEAYISLSERLARMSVRVEPGTQVDAPLDYQDTNKTMPSYSDWETSMAEFGLFSMWYGDGDGLWTAPSGEEHDALLAEHPGCAEISTDHLVAIDAALGRWERGEVVPHRYISGGSTVPDPKERTEDWRKWRDGTIRWLHFWFRWAAVNCEYPSVANH